MKARAILDKARQSVESGEGLGGTGFWRLVRDIKRNPDEGEALLEEVAAIDQDAFSRWALLQLPVWLGTAVMSAVGVLGLVLVGLAYPTDGIWSGIWLLAGTGAVIVASHGLAHLAVGYMVGIRFTSWFIGTIKKPQPGVKTDYVSYLRTPAMSRAWMHAAGAIATKLVPFLMIGAGVAADAPAWSVWVLAAIGIVTLVTDVLWSTKVSDWMKFQREREFAQDS